MQLKIELIFAYLRTVFLKKKIAGNWTKARDSINIRWKTYIFRLENPKTLSNDKMLPRGVLHLQTSSFLSTLVFQDLTHVFILELTYHDEVAICHHLISSPTKQSVLSFTFIVYKARDLFGSQQNSALHLLRVYWLR